MTPDRTANERLRRKFAEKANVVGPWIERQMDAVAALGMGMQGSLEETLHRLQQYEQGSVQYRPHMDELEKCHQEIQEAMIFENRYTQYTMETLRVGWEQLLTSIHRNINEVENQVRPGGSLCLFGIKVPLSKHQGRP